MTGTRQREAWRRRELPPVEQVTGGVWSVPVPIPDNPLRYVLSYLIEHRSGFVMVDPGWDHPESWDALRAGLDACGIPMTAVTAIVLTHVHPDHHGLSAAVREQSGAWIGMHAREDAWLGRRFTARGGRAREWAAYLRWCGAPAAHIEEVTVSYRNADGRRRPMARADRALEHGDLIDAPGLTLRAVWTPGHSPGHLCFRDETHDLMLTGDHVLPRITPNVSAYDMDSQPLQEYLRSLDALRGVQPGEVLPAHEYRFRDLDTRLDALGEHHAQRLGEVRQVLAASPDGLSTWRVAEQVTWSRGWDQLSGFPRQAALGEVLAHLRHLQAEGIATCLQGGGVGRWRTAV